MDRIRIANMTFYGHHGVGAPERELGGRFHIDIELCVDLRAAGRSDNVADTVDYQKVYEVVAQVESARRYRLLEALGHEVAEAILAEFEVEEVTVRVRKASAPLGGLIDFAEVEITRRHGS